MTANDTGSEHTGEIDLDDLLVSISDGDGVQATPQDAEAEAIIEITARLAAVLASESDNSSSHAPRTFVLEPLGHDTNEDPIACAQDVSSLFTVFATALQKRYEKCELASVVELAAETNHPHLHIIERGSNMRLRAIRSAAALAGLKMWIKRKDGFLPGEIEKPSTYSCYLMKLWLSSLRLKDPDATVVREFGHKMNGEGYFAATEGFLALETEPTWEPYKATVKKFIDTYPFASHIAPVVKDQLSKEGLALLGEPPDDTPIPPEVLDLLDDVGV